MTFVAKGDANAILEVVFTVSFARPFTPQELDGLAADHDRRWNKSLPRLARTSQFALPDGFSFGPIGIGPPTGNALGVAFEKYKPDGSLDWRLLADGSHMFINCLSYTQWPAIWETAARYLSYAMPVVAGTNRIQSVGLQYLNMFEWAGADDAYDVGQLLNVDGDLISRSVGNRGPLWHYHVGWFERGVDGDNGSRTLHRCHFDALADVGIPAHVKIDNLSRLDLASPLPVAALRDGQIDRLFNALHDHNKSHFMAYLSGSMKEKLGL